MVKKKVNNYIRKNE